MHLLRGVKAPDRFLSYEGYRSLSFSYQMRAELVRDVVTDERFEAEEVTRG